MASGPFTYVCIVVVVVVAVVVGVGGVGVGGGVFIISLQAGDQRVELIDTKDTAIFDMLLDKR